MGRSARQVFVCINLLLSLSSYSQVHSSRISKNTFFIDIQSSGPRYSLNYDRIFSGKNKIKFSYRVGIHYLKEDIGLPLGVSMLTGSGNHHPEFSLTVFPYIERFNFLFKEGNLSDKQLYIIPGIGYRYQKPQGGLFLRTLFSPMIFLDPPSDDFWKMESGVYGLLSVGAGWTFGNNN